jgi:hypothetical protein
MGFLDRIRNKGAPATPQEADQLVLRQLTGQGADLAKPRHDTPSHDYAHDTSARDAAARIGRSERETAIGAPDERIAEWSVRAASYRVIGTETVDAFRAWFEEIAAEFHGEYDGWEASARP